MKNEGGALTSGAFRVAYYWSDDSLITPGDVFSGSFCDLTDLDPGETGACNLLVEVPSALTPGPQFLGAIVDDLEEVTESVETNNARAADTGPVQLIDTCVLTLDLSYADSILRMDLDLGTIEPAAMGVWILSLFGVSEVWSSPIPVVDPIISFPAKFPLPGIGNIAVIAGLSTLDSGLTCFDFKTVDTGGLGASAEELQDLLEQSGILERDLSAYKPSPARR